MIGLTKRRKRLQELIKKNNCLIIADFNLSSGMKSSFYFDCKRLALDGEGLCLLTQEILAEIDNLPSIPTAIGGLAIGADFLVASVIAKAFELGHPTIRGSIVRKEPKKHGTKNKIENQLERGTKIVVIDDVITSGSSIEKACEEFKQAGYDIVGIIAIIDRQAGGKEKLEREYGTVRTLFTKNDLAIV